MKYVVVFHVFLFKGKAEGIQAPYLNKALYPHTDIKEGVFTEAKQQYTACFASTPWAHRTGER